MSTYSGRDKRLAELFEHGGGGGGGTTVVANPSGEATDDLEKLQVGETIYDIPTGGSSTLAGLGDVNLSSPTDGQVLKYDETNDEWVNGSGGSGGGELYLNTIYSETEEKIGYWTDGKPLYQRSLEITNVTANNGWTQLFNDSNAILVGYDGAGSYCENINGEKLEFDSYRSTSQYTTFLIYDNNHKAQIWYTAPYNLTKVIVTLRYTKTTDTSEIPQRGNVIYLPTIYSDEEREVGVWRDGKPLYQLSVVLPSQTIINSNAWYTTSISNANIEKIPYARGMNDEGTSFPLMANCDATGSGVNYVQIGNPRAAAIGVKEFVIQYTKTTDIAGSGSWTPSGTPAVHYSTDEQVVGTWVDGSTLYERTIFEQPTSYSSGGTASISVGNINVHNIKGGVCTSTGSDNIAFGYTNISPNEYVRIYQSGTSLSIYNSFYSSRPYICATIQYTKSS